jgi:hypothetical protein
VCEAVVGGRRTPSLVTSRLSTEDSTLITQINFSINK